MNNLTYENCNLYLIDLFPQLQESFIQEGKKWKNAQISPHIVYGSIFSKFVRDAVQSSTSKTSKEIIDKAFNFMEIMSNSVDIRVICLLETGLLESLLGETKEDWSLFSPYFKSNTKKIAENLAVKMGMNSQD